MQRLSAILPAALLALVAPGAASAAATLFDFESEAERAALPYRARGAKTLDPVPEFATSGALALRFATPVWKKGMDEWPSFTLKPSVTNWSDYDRLVLDLVNPAEERFFFSLFVSDTKVPFQKGLSHPFALPTRGYRRFVVPLSLFPKTVNRADIAIVHLFTERPKSDLALYLDNFTLLRKGETLPEPGPAFVRQLGALKTGQAQAAEQALAKAREAAGGLPLFAELEKRLAAIRAELAAPDLTLARLTALGDELAALPAKAERGVAVAKFRQACREKGQTAAGMLLGLATSMEKILPRDAPFELTPAGVAEISLARNEKESFQVVVLPAAEALHKVAVSAADLKSADGAVLARTNIQCEVVGYVQTRSRPPYGSAHIGWWPDPILDFLGPVDIAAGDAQSFWIRVRAPRDQPAGIYKGALTVSAEGVPAQRMPLTVRVRSFTLPDAGSLPLAITFAPEDSPIADTREAQDEWRRSDDYPTRAWRGQKARWAGFLADYGITYDSLYHHGMPDYEILAQLQKEGRLGRFNLGYWDYVGKDLEKWKSKTLPRLRAAYDRAKELGLLDHSYLYGCDEVDPSEFPRVEQAAAILKAEFPGTLIMTTTRDKSYGLSNGIASVDAFCPLTPDYNPARAAAARAAGKQVWWYICCGPQHPHANMFIEYPAIEGRLLMGAMTARERPDGFLYYQISIWNARHPIAAGPFTDWEPRSWTTYHGDGSWTCVGPGGGPLPTLRLENFRDGLEDFAYVRILEDLVRTREAGALDESGKVWLAAAKAAMAVPETLVKSQTDYARDPAVLYAWRNGFADLIEHAPPGAK